MKTEQTIWLWKRLEISAGPEVNIYGSVLQIALCYISSLFDEDSWNLSALLLCIPNSLFLFGKSTPFEHKKSHFRESEKEVF